MKYLILITCISLGVIIPSWLRNNKKDHFLIRLTAWLSGDSWNYPNALIEWPSDFELIRRSRIRRSREGNVIPFPTKNKNEERLISNIKKMAKEVEKLPKEERKKWYRDIQRCNRLSVQRIPTDD